MLQRGPDKPGIPGVPLPDPEPGTTGTTKEGPKSSFALRARHSSKLRF